MIKSPFIKNPTRVELIRHSFPDDESWVLNDIPIGTIYDLLGWHECTITNENTGETREIIAYQVSRDGSTGYLPACCFRLIES